MADDIKPRIRIPQNPRKGDVLEIKTLITHPMESGQRRDVEGNLVPRRIVNALSVTYNGKPVISATYEPAVSANPYLAFHVRVEESGVLAFEWKDDDGTLYKAEEKIALAG